MTAVLEHSEPAVVDDARADDSSDRTGPDPSRPAPIPWTPVDLVLLTAGVLVGTLLITAAWFGASSEVDATHQVRWLNVGGAGVMVVGAASALWILRGHRAVARRRVEVLGRPLATAVADLTPPEGAASAPALELVSGKGMSKYHRPDCPFVEGKTVKARTRAQYRRGRRQPCAVCQPDASEDR